MIIFIFMCIFAPFVNCEETTVPNTNLPVTEDFSAQQAEVDSLAASVTLYLEECKQWRKLCYNVPVEQQDAAKVCKEWSDEHLRTVSPLTTDGFRTHIEKLESYINFNKGYTKYYQSVCTY